MVRAVCRCAGEHFRSVYADGALQIVRKAIPVAGLEGDVVNADDAGVAWKKKTRRYVAIKTTKPALRTNDGIKKSSPPITCE